MELLTFAAAFAWMALLILLSYAIDWVWNRIFMGRGYQYFIAPGLIIHEGSHWLMCKLTRTKVVHVTLISPTGGKVEHQKRGPLVTVLIGMAPLFGCSLALFILAWGLGYTRLYSGVNLESGPGVFLDVLRNIWTLIADTHDEGGWWPWLRLTIFVYLCLAIGTSIAPSGVDLKHSAIGMAAIFLVSAGLIYLHPLGYLPWFKDTPTPVLDAAVGAAMIVVGMGIAAAVVGLILSIPAALIYRAAKR